MYCVLTVHFFTFCYNNGYFQRKQHLSAYNVPILYLIIHDLFSGVLHEMFFKIRKKIKGARNFENNNCIKTSLMQIRIIKSHKA